MVSGYSVACQVYDRLLCDVDEHSNITFNIVRLKVDSFIKPNTMIPQYNELPKNGENVFAITEIR